MDLGPITIVRGVQCRDCRAFARSGEPIRHRAGCSLDLSRYSDTEIEAARRTVLQRLGILRCP